MIDFSFTEEQLMIQKTMREFAEKELLPRYQYYDQTEEFPWDQWEKLKKIGVSGALRITEKYGGNFTDLVTLGIMIKELARGDFNVAYFVCQGALTEFVEKYGCESFKEKWLPVFARGEKLLALCVTEPQCGSDAAAMQTRAVKEGGYYILNGEKSAATWTMDAHVLIVFAKTNPEAGARGISAFFLPADLPGVTRTPFKDMGARSIRRGSVFLDNVKIPEEYLLGEEGKGFHQAMAVIDILRVLLCLMCVGAVEKTIEETIEYVKTRTAFGQPLSKFQGVSFPIVEHYTKNIASQWLCFYTLWMHDQGLRHTKETAMCKYLVPELAVQAIHDCLQLHGHYGYTQDFPLEQRLRDVMGNEFGDGTAQIQKLIIARELIGREFV